MTSSTKRRTYDRETWLAAQAAWDSGRFSPEWREVRHLAAMRAGIIFPPDGTEYDSWGDDSPSQRAILIRAIRETPTMLRDAITAPGVRSWGDVIERLLGRRDSLRDDVERDERDAAFRREQQASPRQATYALRDILGVIVDSR